MKIIDRYGALVRAFVTVAASALVMSAVAGPAAAQGNSAKLQFSGGIGVIPVSNVTCSPVTTTPETCTGTGLTVTVTANIVRGQQPGGQIWLLNQLAGTVNTDGSINVSGNLVFGGGNNAGTGNSPTGAAVQLYATLSCSSSATSPPTSFLLSSTPMTGTALPTLSPNGDFQISAMLSPPPNLTSCPQPLLLIQSVSNKHWFALGFVK
jgi:hypothetical protein